MLYYIVERQPKRKYQTSMRVVVMLVHADNRAQAIRAANAIPEFSGASSDHYTKPHVTPLIFDTVQYF